MASSNSYRYWLLALLPLVLAWAYLNKVWIGSFFVIGDNTNYFYWFIYYFENILKGVYPLWNPFKAWGSLDYIDTQYIGTLNLVSLVIPLLLFFGVKAYWAYASYAVLIWMVGLGGFFFLLNRIYNDPRVAWLGTVLLMFSSSVAVYFSWELLCLYIFVPVGWFFGFLIGFVRSSDDAALKKNMFGLSFSMMFVAHLYVPFYFLTLFFAFIVSVLSFARQWIMQFLQASQRAFKRMPLGALFCLVSVLLALWPTVDCYLKMKDPQNVTKFFRGDNEDKAGNSLDVSQQMIDIGGLPSRSLFSEFFSSFETGDAYLTFVPLILFILALLTLFNRSSTAQRVIFMTGFLLLLMTITNASPLQHILYKHVFFFRLFRNYFFFWILFWPCLVVFVMGETKQFLAMDLVASKERVVYAGWVILVHAGAVIYLMSLDDVPVVSYATLMASCCWFLARLFEAIRIRKSLFIVVLAFIGLWEPFYVLPMIRGMAHLDLEYAGRPGAFSFVRPLFGSGYNEKNALADRKKYFQDESGFVQSGYMGQRGSYLLGQNLSKETLADYVRYKFILYDQICLINDNDIDWEKVRRVVTFQDRCALIGYPSGIALPNANAPAEPMIIKGPSVHFKVVHFDVNAITLGINLDQRKFLVYNDSFHSGWHVLVDHRPVKLYQANIAFKGIWIEKGSHLVQFCFGSWFDYVRGWGVSLLFLVWLFLVIAQFLPRFKRAP